MLQHALKAQSRGFHIFPVAGGQKVPHRQAGSWGQTATNDINRIIHFWTQVDPNANIGVACKPSRLLVIDLDTAKGDWNLKGTDWAYLHGAYGPRVSGEDLWDEMAFRLGGDRPSDLMTYSVRTGSGGLHLYYHWPQYWGQQSQASPVKGVIDVRGNGGQWGGYVLAEGSVTDAGPYVSTQTSERDQVAPGWVRQMVTPKPKIQSPGRLSGIRQPGAVSWSGLVDSVRNAGEGNRNNTLLWAARSMYSDGAPESEAMDVLGQAASEAGLPHYEAERTIQSAYRIQQQKEG